MKKIAAISVLLAFSVLFVSCVLPPQTTAETKDETFGERTYPSTGEETFTDTFSRETRETEEKTATPLFWEVSGNGYEGKMYLLGAIHSGKADTNVFPDLIMNAFEESEYLAVESDVIRIEYDPNATQLSIAPFVFNDGSRTKNILSSDLYDKAKKILAEAKIFSEYMNYYSPVFWALQIEGIASENSDLRSEYGTDRFFLLSARKTDKKIAELEDYFETYQRIAAISIEAQVYLLSKYCEPDFCSEYSSSANAIYDAWYSGDEETLNELLFPASSDETDTDNIKYEEEYNSAVNGTRSSDMTEALLEHIEKNEDVFCTVGLYHLIGENGMIAALRDKGYTVTEIEYETDAPETEEAVTETNETDNIN